MRRQAIAALLGVWVAIGAALAASPAEEPRDAMRGNALAGRDKSAAERCQECHGHDGNAADEEEGNGNVGKFPRLAGQQYAYLVKQLHDFRSGRRANETMNAMADGIAEPDIADIAAYFASQKARHDESAAPSLLGRRLFAEGDARRGIPPCAGCHGPDARGTAIGPVSIPSLAGQYKRYLQKHLHEWRSGERHNSPKGVMGDIARRLDDADIDALAEYLSAQ